MNAGHESTPRGESPVSSGARSLEQIIDGLEQRLDELAQRQRTTRLVMLGGSVVLLGLMAIFGFALFKTLERQLNLAQLQSAFMAKVDQMWPPLSKKFIDSASKAAPVFGDLAMERFEKVRPQLETMLVAEAEKFSQHLQAGLLARTEAGMQRVTEKVSNDLKNQLPNVTERKLDEIEEKLRQSLLVEGGGIADQLEATVAKERGRVEDLLARLPVDRVATQPEEELHRQFIHHVLMMIDQAVASDPSAQQ